MAAQDSSGPVRGAIAEDLGVIGEQSAFRRSFPTVPARSLFARNRPFLARGSGCCGDWRGPVPGQEVVEPAHWIAVGQAFENVFEVGERLDVIQLCGGQQRGDDRPSRRPAIGAGEQMVLAAERDGTDGTFDRVVIEFDVAVEDRKSVV